MNSSILAIKIETNIMFLWSFFLSDMTALFLFNVSASTFQYKTILCTLRVLGIIAGKKESSWI